MAPRDPQVQPGPPLHSKDDPVATPRSRVANYLFVPSPALYHRVSGIQIEGIYGFLNMRQETAQQRYAIRVHGTCTA